MMISCVFDEIGEEYAEIIPHGGGAASSHAAGKMAENIMVLMCREV
ncbi:MAG: hypothetical protein ACNI3A_06235 [Desulfovibrio sp.]